MGSAGAVAWVLWIVAGDRAIGLPGGRGRPITESFPRVAMVIAAITLAAGPALAALQYSFARAQSDVMPNVGGSFSGGFPAVVPRATGRPAGAPLRPPPRTRGGAPPGAPPAAARTHPPRPRLLPPA